MSSAASFTLDTTSFNRAMGEFASVTKRGLVDVCKYAAKGFVKRAVAITPPAKGTLSGAKAYGQSAIAGDIKAMFEPARSAAQRRDAVANAAAFHAANKKIGLRKKKANVQRFADPRQISQLRKALFLRVGKLASGWGAAAQKLALPLPNWITRHGNGRGHVTITIASGGVAIEMANNVAFVGSIRNLKRNVRAALKYQEGAMLRQISHILEKARKKAFR